MVRYLVGECNVPYDARPVTIDGNSLGGTVRSAGAGAGAGAGEGGDEDDEFEALVNGLGAELRAPPPQPVLWDAILQSSVKCVEALLGVGADPNSARPVDGATPLHMLFGDTVDGNLRKAMADCLLRHGADPSATMHSGHTPAFLAAQFGDGEVLTMLIQHGGDVTTRAHSSDYGPLDIAAEQNHTNIIKLLCTLCGVPVS